MNDADRANTTLKKMGKFPNVEPKLGPDEVACWETWMERNFLRPGWQLLEMSLVILKQGMNL